MEPLEYYVNPLITKSVNTSAKWSSYNEGGSFIRVTKVVYLDLKERLLIRGSLLMGEIRYITYIYKPYTLP